MKRKMCKIQAFQVEVTYATEPLEFNVKIA